MGSVFNKWLNRMSPADLEELTDLSTREAEVVYYKIRDRSDSEIAEKMGVEVGTVKSFHSKIRRKGDKWKTNLRTLIESDVYQPADVVIEFHETDEYESGEFDRDRLESFLSNVLKEEDDYIQELADFSRELRTIADERRSRLVDLKRRLAKQGVFDARGWEVMERKERTQYLRDIIDTYEIANDDPVPRAYIINSLAEELQATDAEAEQLIEKLMTRGDLYEPTRDHFLCT